MMKRRFFQCWTLALLPATLWSLQDERLIGNQRALTAEKMRHSLEKQAASLRVQQEQLLSHSTPATEQNSKKQNSQEQESVQAAGEVIFDEEAAPQETSEVAEFGTETLPPPLPVLPAPGCANELPHSDLLSALQPHLAPALTLVRLLGGFDSEASSGKLPDTTANFDSSLYPQQPPVWGNPFVIPSFRSGKPDCAVPHRTSGDVTDDTRGKP